MYHFSEEIAFHFLSEPRCAPCIRFIALSVPFCCIHSLVNGFCYSMKKSAFPAFSQLLEQILRFFVIAFVAFLCLKRNATCNISLCALGILVAEAAACIVSIGYLHLYLQKNKISLPSFSRILAGCPDLFRFVWPLTLSRFVVQFLLSAEAALIPAGLCRFGYPKEEALALYGILTGMALPFLLFPTAITGSLSVLLLPSISEAHAKNNTKKIRELTVRVIYAATLLGISAARVQEDRFAALDALAALAPAVWVLKGAGTLIAVPDEPSVISPWDVPQLAVAGSGDVLAGAVGTFLAQGHAAGTAAALGVWLHALAGISLSPHFPMRGNSPQHIAHALPSVLAALGIPSRGESCPSF